MFTAALLAQALLASTAFAAIPSNNARLASRVERRRQSKPLNLLEAHEQTNATHVSYSSNWAGAAYSDAKGTYTSVTGTFTVPTPKEPSSGSGTHSASAWVGIDGDSCENAILQTGVDFNIDGSKVTYDAWYEWYPAVSYDFDGISFSAGDVVTLTVTATTTKKGEAVIENTTTGKKVTKSLSSSSALCQQDAEWIVEDFEEGSSLVPFANFGTVEFTKASATKSSGKVGPSDATVMDIKQSSKVLTTSSVGDSTVTVKYKS